MCLCVQLADKTLLAEAVKVSENAEIESVRIRRSLTHFMRLKTDTCNHVSPYRFW